MAIAGDLIREMFAKPKVKGTHSERFGWDNLTFDWS